MLKPLSTLIKISKSKLDSKRKELALLLDLKQQKIDEIKRLEENITFEEANLKELGEEFRRQFITYVFGVRQKEGYILESIEQMNPQINKISDEITELFTEMKKYEILKETRQNEIRAELTRKTQIEIDEIAIMSHLRKTDTEYYN